MQDTPPAGGDTLWASGYEMYDRVSPPFQKFFESLTASCAQPVFKSACEAGGYDVMSPRGSPLNVDYQFEPHHPVVCTHPVTGWKSLFAGVGLHVSRIDGVTSYEDNMIREYVLRILTRNHDCVARMHWTRGACAIWSNVCTLHAATVSNPPSSSIERISANETAARHASGGRDQDRRASLGYWGRAILRPGEHWKKGGAGHGAVLRADMLLNGH